MKANDDGIGLVEIVVSMFLFALMAVAFLPAIIRGYESTRINTTLSTATQLLSGQLEVLRTASGQACSSLLIFDATPVTDDRGVALHPTRTVTCPSTYPGTARVVVGMADAANVPVETATTLVVVVGP